jgi:hypothetical protein
MKKLATDISVSRAPKNRKKWAAIILALVVIFSTSFFYIRRTKSTTETSDDNPQITPSASKLGLDSFSPRQIGNPPEGNAWIADVLIVDLDKDGLKDILVADARLNKVSWIRQTSLRVFEEQDIGRPVAAPVHLEVADMNGDGHLDVLVSSMGKVRPNNEKIGAVVVLVNDGTNHFTNRVLLDNVARVTYVAAADFNKDGQPDLIVGQFGYAEGEIRWLENLGNWHFKSHPLLDLPGTIHAPVADMDGDGNLDVVAFVTQGFEEVHFFQGNSLGHFRDRVLWGSTNKDFGGSGLCIADVNNDKKPDIVFTDGDGFDSSTPGPRPWHGVQWLENVGRGQFSYHKVGDFPGAFSPVVVDIDGDGDQDIVCCSGFNDWNDPNAVSLACFENNGKNQFVQRVLAHVPTHLIVLKSAELYNDGHVELVTGCFAFYPPYDRAARVTLWEPKLSPH